jgi:hypothetical protein
MVILPISSEWCRNPLQRHDLYRGVRLAFTNSVKFIQLRKRSISQGILCRNLLCVKGIATADDRVRDDGTPIA